MEEMRKVTLSCLVLICVFLNSCGVHDAEKKRQDGTIVWAAENPQITDRLRSVLREFWKLEGGPNQCIYELYIDKKDARVTALVIKRRAFLQEYIEKARPSFVLELDGHRVLVYTGLEDYLTSSFSDPVIQSGISSDSCQFRSVLFKDSVGNVRRVADVGVPFAPFPSEGEPVLAN
jgi:hypothetical protein